MNITHLIKHPEELDKETLYDLRSLIALYPYYQPARILLLQNLFLLHDPTFDEELRRAAVYITNRQTLFELVEAAHYKPQQVKKVIESTPSGDRTTSLIDDFLSQIPKSQPKASEETKKPTPADATIDYVPICCNPITEIKSIAPPNSKAKRSLITSLVTKAVK